MLLRGDVSRRDLIKSQYYRNLNIRKGVFNIHIVLFYIVTKILISGFHASDSQICSSHFFQMTFDEDEITGPQILEEEDISYKNYHLAYQKCRGRHIIGGGHNREGSYPTVYRLLNNIAKCGCEEWSVLPCLNVSSIEGESFDFRNTLLMAKGSNGALLNSYDLLDLMELLGFNRTVEVDIHSPQWKVCKTKITFQIRHHVINMLRKKM